MRLRYCIVLFLFINMELAFADDKDWDCEGAEGETWSCAKTSAQDKNKEKSVMSLPESSTDNSSKPAANKIIAMPVPTPVKKSSVSVRPPQHVNQNTGWNCFSSDGDETWNCSLTGADPEGKAISVEDESAKSFSLFSDAFDFQQEQDFELLESRLNYNPWENCSSSQNQPVYIRDESLRDLEPMDITADYSEVFDKEITSFFGNVNISRADQKITADKASYDTVSETMDVQGHVFYTENEISLHSDTALLNLATDEARLRNALFISPSGPFRGKSDVVYRDSKVLSRYKNAAFTSCRPGNQDWVVHAERVKMNKQTGLGSAKNAWLEIKGIPVFYTPYVAFPLDDRRMSGFLAPSFGSGKDTGFDTSIPYYWNIAPNYDLTVWARYMTKRGGMFGGEFRYQSKITDEMKTAGSVGMEFLPYDWLRDESRYSGSFRNYTQFTPHLIADIDLNYISDKEYFDELSDSLGMRGFSQPQDTTNRLLGITQDRFLQSQASLSYSSKGISFITAAESYQTIDNEVTESAKPYYKLPEVILNLSHSFEDWPIDLGMENEYINFYQKGRVYRGGPRDIVPPLKQCLLEDENNVVCFKERAIGHRFNIKPFVSVPMESEGAFLKPKFSMQYTQYFIDNPDFGKANKVTRILPIVSVDSGLVFERDLEFGNSGFLHTLEPRVFYLYIPKTNQNDVTVFDSVEYDFSYGSLFRENRFSGNDLVQDANQITLAMSSSLIDSETGEERLRLSVGEILYLRDREVTLTGVPETYGWSNLVAEMRGKLTENWSFSSGIQWNPEINDVSRGHAEITYRNLDQPGHIINLGYRYRSEVDEVAARKIVQTDASFRWPIYDNWFAVGRWQYSLRHNSTKESFLGLEKESCCWRFSIIWRRYANTLDTLSDNLSTDLNDSTERMEEGIFVQIELKGFGDFGDNVDEFLEYNLNGYERIE